MDFEKGQVKRKYSIFTEISEENTELKIVNSVIENEVNHIENISFISLYIYPILLKKGEMGQKSLFCLM
jgi:hypothetical protein